MQIFKENVLYRSLLASNVIGKIGHTLFDIVFIIYARSFPDAELAVGIASLIVTLPYLVSFIMGYIADEIKLKYRVLMIIRMFQVFLFTFFALLTLIGKNWIVFFLITLINLVSDAVGNLNGYLSLSLYRKIVSENLLSEAFRFQNGIGYIIDLLGRVVGVSVITFLHYNYFGFGLLNAAVFLCSFLLLFYRKESFLLDEVIDKKEEKITGGKIYSKIKTFFRESKKNLYLLYQLKEVFNFTVIFSVMNLISSAMTSLWLLTLVQNDSFIFSTFAFTVALIEFSEIISMIVGSLFPLKWTKNKSIQFILMCEMIVFVLVILNFVWLHNKFAMVCGWIAMGYLSGISSPRIDAHIILTLPKEQQNSVFSIFGTLVTLTVPTGAAIFVFLANTISLPISWCVLLLVSILGLIYTYFIKSSVIKR